MSRNKVLCFVMLLASPLSVRLMAQAGPARLVASESSSLNPADVSSAVVVVVPPAPVAKNASQAGRRVMPFSRVAIGIKTGTLGLGGQIATPLTGWLNLRGGAEFFNFGYGLGVDGANYEGQAHLKSGQVSLDVFPFHSGFHISPGILLFKSAFSASVYVPGGNTFTLGDNTYTSSATDPVHGDANIVFSHTMMPSLTIGFSNMIAREGRHWSVPFEMGAAYTGHYTAQLNLLGTACMSVGCMSTSSAAIHQSLVQEQDSLNEPMKHYQIYPIVTSGLSYRF